MSWFKRPVDPLRKAEALMATARRYLHADDLDKAMKTAAKLDKMGYTGAFEIRAIAFDEMDEPEKAIAEAEKGVAAGARAGSLFTVLGNLYSDAGRYDEALAAFDRAAACEDADDEHIRFNRSIVFSRTGRSAEALAQVEAIPVELHPFGLAVLAQRMDVLIDLGRAEETIALAEGYLDELRDLDDEASQAVGSVLGVLARAHWEGRRDRQAAMQWALDAVELNRHASTAFRVVREIDAQTSPQAVHGELRVVGTWHEPMPGDHRPPDFYREFAVTAESAEAALAFAKRFLPEGVHASATIQGWDPDDEPGPDDWLGVTWSSGYLLTGE